MMCLSLCFISFFFIDFIFVKIYNKYIVLLMIVYFIEWEIISLYSWSIVMTLLLDWMSLLFMSFVMLISSLVILYSQDYMEGDKTLNYLFFGFNVCFINNILND